MGLGVLLGSMIAGLTVSSFESQTGDHLWANIWILPALVAFVAALYTHLYFHPQGENKPQQKSTPTGL